ncbi:MAG TPA: glycosyltransferase family 39 protein [Pirellulales bacterium]|nr:glycosyltransferase family 39 protein [Pirellulales bacterium]
MALSRPIIGVLAAALVLRIAAPLVALAVATPEPQFREPDSAGYVRAAEQLWHTGRLGTRQEPNVVRTPGYPLLLVPGVAAGHLDSVAIGLQIVLACATVFFVYQTALVACRGARAALAAAWLAACDPVSIVYASKLLTESSFATFLAATLWLLARYADGRRWGDLLAAAVVMAAAAYIRPIAYFLPVWTGLAMLAILWRGEANRRRLALEAAAFVAVTILLIAPWQMRNLATAGYDGFAAISDVNLYYYEALPVLADQRGMAPEEADGMRIEEGEGSEANYLLKHPEQRDWPSAERYRFLRREAIRIIRSDPLRFARLHVAGIIHMLTDSGRNGWLSFFRLADTSKPAQPQPSRSFWERLTTAVAQKPLVLAIHGLLCVILTAYLALAVVGLASPTSRTPAMLVVLAVAAYLVVLSGGEAAYHRFRVPLVPVICLAAGQGYALLVRAWPRRHAEPHAPRPG